MTAVPGVPAVTVKGVAMPATLNWVTLSCAMGVSTSLSGVPPVMRLPAAEPLIGAVLASGLAFGASLTGAILMVVVAMGEVAPWLSLTLKAMLTVPLKLGAGVKMSPAACAGVNGVFAAIGVPSASLRTPWAANGSVVTVINAIGLSGSVPVSGTGIGLAGSSDALIVPTVAVGLSLMPLMLMVSVVELVPPLLSVMR